MRVSFLLGVKDVMVFLLGKKHDKDLSFGFAYIEAHRSLGDIERRADLITLEQMIIEGLSKLYGSFVEDFLVLFNADDVSCSIFLKDTSNIL